MYVNFISQEFQSVPNIKVNIRNFYNSVVCFISLCSFVSPPFCVRWSFHKVISFFKLKERKNKLKLHLLIGGKEVREKDFIV